MCVIVHQLSKRLKEVEKDRNMSNDAEENGEHNLYDEDEVDKKLDDQKCGSPDQSENS